MKFENSDQLKGFLKNEQKRLGISIANTYSTYLSRLLLERVNKIGNKEIVVKGSFSQLVHLGTMARAITDVDLASRYHHHNPMLELNEAMCLNEETGLSYDYRKKPTKTPTGIYKIYLWCSIDKLQQPLSIDFRENHPCIYEIQAKEVPAIFKGDKPYTVLVPSYEEHLAEKLCIIAESQKADVLNTRVKDFYDIYQLHGGNYDLDKFSYYFERMLQDRNKMGNNALTTDYLNLDFIERHQSVWDSTKKKYDFLDDTIDFAGSLYYTRGVLREQIQRIQQGKNKVYTL